MQSIYLTDLISVQQLQMLQDSFSRMTGMAALTTDASGKPVTEGSNFTDYCMKYARNSEIGRKRCEKCYLEGACKTRETGRATTYVCHSGLIDFAAPIMFENYLIGSFIGGQVLTIEPDRESIQVIADDLGVPFEEYWEAVKKVPVISRKRINEAADFLCEIAKVISDIAYSKYISIKNQEEIERVANMKSDFLANMSHEIRTPMNAVIGMAEMALREDLPPAARDYISQIKSSGNALLNIINDILDFSKIESGKMDIITEEYEPLSVMHDISSILMTRLRDKNVELIGTINPKAPRLIVGDMLRIRQIVINIANNAIKFTNHGYVWVNIDFVKRSETDADFIISIKDTGIGIKKENLGKLFDAFQQLDSKRNRNIEGTGLGLAITSRLLDLMGGKICVESEYGVGSTFTMKIPQKVVSWDPVIDIKDKENKVAIGYWRGSTGMKMFYESLNQMGVDSYALITLDHMEHLKKMYSDNLKDKTVYLFTSHENYKNEMQEFINKYPDINFIVSCDFFAKLEESHANVNLIKKPFSNLAIAAALNNEDRNNADSDSFEFEFIAPDAKIMIVDDNDVNLIVAEGLLEPLKMQVTKASSGKMALDILANEHFDIVFMDHMMPELDGVETTRIIRRLHPDLDSMPIIALTANAVGEAKKMFISEGMNDFVAKPIEMRSIVSAIRTWLPKEKIIKRNEALSPDENKRGTGEQLSLNNISDSIECEKLIIGDLDIDAALSMIGNEKLYMTILEKYYSAIKQKAFLIKVSEENEDIKTYTIEVHALKSSSKQIGAMELSDMAAALEAAGNENDIKMIHEKTDALIERYVGYIDVLKPYFGETEDENEKAEKPLITKETLMELLEKMSEAADDLDMDGMEETAGKLDEYSFEKGADELFIKLKEAASNIDVDSIEEIITEWRTLL